MREYQTETGAPFTDSLTDLFNHGFFQIVLDREINRSDRYGEPLTLALIDLDSFADYNRLHGSVEGDRVLKEISGLIMKNIRQIDLPWSLWKESGKQWTCSVMGHQQSVPDLLLAPKMQLIVKT
jgi:hypothetical protein